YVISKGADNFKSLKVFKITPKTSHAYASVFTFSKIKKQTLPLNFFIFFCFLY
ncbi:hypothetical protein HMPREF3188_01591, partial [Tissierellia bacterium KA00581]